MAVTYTGEFHETVDRTTGSPESTVRDLHWSAMGTSGGHDGALPLTYTSMSGSVINEYSSGCRGFAGIYSLPHVNPQPGAWGLNETSEYPQRGWKYIVAS